MKKTTLLIAILIAATGLTNSQAQGTWTQKADFGGGTRLFAAGFSIGGKGYIGTGYGNGSTNDFWAYDPVVDTWTQKADFPGGGVSSQTGFSIGASKGYLGPYSFSEYDPAADTWTQKAPYPGFGASEASSFSIGNKGYMGAGSLRNDFWEYDPAADAWTQKGNIGEVGRSASVGFSIGGVGYMGTGYSYSQYLKDFWAFDPSAGTWTQKADFGGSARAYATGFAIANKGYIGTGRSDDSYALRDFWEYDPTTNTWTQKADFGGGDRTYATAFSIGSKGYIGTGESADYADHEDFWEYTPDAGGGSTCAVPSALSTSNVMDTSATLSWNAVSGAVEYQLNYKVVGATKWIVVRSTGNNTTLWGLTSGTNYVWRVTTVCSKSPLVASAYSGQVQFTTTEATTTTCDFATNLHTGESATPSEACDIPSNVTEVEILPTRAIIRWDAVSGALGYEIKYYEFYPEQGATLFVCTTRMRVTLENLQRNAFYRYSIRAICSQDPLIVSDYTPESEFRTPQRPR